MSEVKSKKKVNVKSKVNKLLPFVVGEKYFFRTVTYHCVGEVKKIIGDFVELSNASWIADSGRFMQTIKDGSLDEVEPVGQMWLNSTTVIDFFPWKHKLPVDQK